MKPSELAAQLSEINSFKYYMLDAYSKFTGKFSTEFKESNDVRHIEFNKQRVELATVYIECMIDYFTPTTESDENFFTIEEFYDIVRHLNRIFGTQYWIELE